MPGTKYTKTGKPVRTGYSKPTSYKPMDYGKPTRMPKPPPKGQKGK